MVIVLNGKYFQLSVIVLKICESAESSESTESGESAEPSESIVLNNHKPHGYGYGIERKIFPVVINCLKNM